MPTTAGITFETASGTERLSSLEASSIKLFSLEALLFVLLASFDERSASELSDVPRPKKFSNEKLSSIYL